VRVGIEQSNRVAAELLAATATLLAQAFQLNSLYSPSVQRILIVILKLFLLSMVVSSCHLFCSSMQWETWHG